MLVLAVYGAIAAWVLIIVLAARRKPRAPWLLRPLGAAVLVATLFGGVYLASGGSFGSAEPEKLKQAEAMTSSACLSGDRAAYAMKLSEARQLLSTLPSQEEQDANAKLDNQLRLTGCPLE